MLWAAFCGNRDMSEFTVPWGSSPPPHCPPAPSASSAAGSASPRGCVPCFCLQGQKIFGAGLHAAFSPSGCSPHVRATGVAVPGRSLARSDPPGAAPCLAAGKGERGSSASPLAAGDARVQHGVTGAEKWGSQWRVWPWEVEIFRSLPLAAGGEGLCAGEEGLPLGRSRSPQSSFAFGYYLCGGVTRGTYLKCCVGAIEHQICEIQVGNYCQTPAPST